MHSLKELFKIGNGPSSSHTIGPKKATLEFNKRYSDCDYVKVILYGSLALTGKGHLTDYIIDKTLTKNHDIEFNYLDLPPHPNTIDFIPYKNHLPLPRFRVFSVGGGAIKIEGEKEAESQNVYPLNSLQDIKEYCQKENINLFEFVKRFDDKDILEYLETIYNQMLLSIDNGLKKDGVLQGKLQIKRKAKMLFNKNVEGEGLNAKLIRHLYAYAYAVSEENADGFEIVTAPTCGSCGVLPSVLKYSIDKFGVTKEKAIEGLAVAGIIGNLVKTNASISGAEAGCQAEIGTACAMSSAYYAYVLGSDFNHIEQASEIALEHHLGLTCDPIMGYVQIPCIERNAVAAVRALDAYNLAKLLDSNESKISFDLICKTMLETGHDLTREYRETSKGGLAKCYKGE